MMSEQDADAKIRAYLDALKQLEIAEEARRHGGDDWFNVLRRLMRLRAMEFYWTISRAATNIGAFFFPDHIGPKAKTPKWRRRDAPVSLTAPPPSSSPRMLLDMTSTLRSGRATGIQRVVREIARNAWETGVGIPVAIHNGRLIPYYRHPALPETIDIAEGDVFVMLDASWNHPGEYPPIMQEIRAKGGASVVCLYDILPLLYPNAFPPGLTRRFEEWLTKIVFESNGVVADSRAAAQSFRDYLRARGQSLPGFPLGWWRLGADFSSAASSAISAPAQRIADGPPFFLGVGTVEPRKGYPVVLDALDALWSQGIDVTYVIVGGRGWGMSVFETRIRTHPEFGRRLFWLQNASDADLTLLYQRACALVLASVAEGFGLPIVEAAGHGAPVIATDIPVFREVAGDSAQYFGLLDSRSLAERLKEALAQKAPAPVIEATTWGESTTQLLAIVRERAYQMRLE